MRLAALNYNTEAPVEAPRFPLAPRAFAAELERRRPFARDIVAALDRFYSTRRTREYNSFAIKNPDGAWRASPNDYHPSVLRSSFLGEPTEGKDDIGCGRYCLNYDDDTTDWFAFDIDAHKPGETAEGNTICIIRELAGMGIDFLLARSSGGRGYHVVAKTSREIPGYVAINLAAWVKRRAGVDPKLEVFPKGPRLGTPDRTGSGQGRISGVQIAVPGNFNFYARTGGGAVLRKDFTEVPLEELAAHIRGIARCDVDRLVAIGEALRADPERAAAEKWRDIFKEHEERREYREPAGGAPGAARFDSPQELAAWAEAHGHPGWVKGNKVVLRACPGNPHGSKRTDGAALLLRRDGGAYFKCHHAACEHFTFEDLLKKWGGAPGAPPEAPAQTPDGAPISAPLPGPGHDPALAHVAGVDPTPRFAERVYLTDEERARATYWSWEAHDPSKVEDPRISGMRVRVKRAAVCGLLGTRTDGVCHGGADHPAHGAVIGKRFACKHRNLCCGCAGSFAERLGRKITEDFAEGLSKHLGNGRYVPGIHLLRYEAPEGTLRERWDALTLMRKRVLKTIGRAAYHWQQGVRSLVVVVDDYAYRTLRAALEKCPVEGAFLEHHDDPCAGAQMIVDNYLEPAREYRRCLVEKDEGGFAALTQLFTDRLRRSDGSRTPRRIPWLSEDAANEAALEESRERRKQAFDGKHCPVKVDVRPDGTMPPPVLLSWEVYHGKDLVAKGLPGAPCWKIEKRAFATLCAVRAFASSA